MCIGSSQFISINVLCHNALEAWVYMQKGSV